MKISAILPAVVLLSAGCRSNRVSEPVNDTYPEVPQVEKIDRTVRSQGPVTMLPRAVIYRTDGDYNDRVAVNLDASRSSLVSYPAPTDVSAASAPVVMKDGWLLDRRGGVGLNTAFLNWTYAEYSALESAPTPAEIMAHVIPGARVTAVRQLPMTASEALADTAAINACIAGRVVEIGR